MRPIRPMLVCGSLLAALCVVQACDDAGGRSAPADQPDDPPSWRDAMQRFEGRLDEMLGELTWTERDARPVTGVFVPADHTPEAARALPSHWLPLQRAEPVPARLVLLVHGLDEPGDIWSDLAEALVSAGYDVARFEYPNDQRVHLSATQMLEHLRAARAAGVQEITVVAHSMGGLVSFDALTQPDGYAGDISGSGEYPRVTRFISVGTPWEGSPWARLRAAAEIREQVTRWLMDESWDVRPVLNYQRDGKGQAGQDLEPGSALLTDLAARPWPEGLPLTSLAGQIARPNPENFRQLEDSKLLRDLLGREQLDALLADLRRASEQLGDGVVSVESALARATDDTHVFEVNHRALIRHSPVDFLTGQEPGGPPGIPVILERLAETDRADQAEGAPSEE